MLQEPDEKPYIGDDLKRIIDDVENAMKQSKFKFQVVLKVHHKFGSTVSLNDLNRVFKDTIENL